MTGQHVHSASSMPASGGGYAVCDCGATAPVVRGVIASDWHACELCTHAYGRPDRPKLQAARKVQR